MSFCLQLRSFGCPVGGLASLWLVCGWFRWFVGNLVGLWMLCGCFVGSLVDLWVVWLICGWFRVLQITFFTSFSLCKQRTTVLIRYWLLASKQTQFTILLFKQSNRWLHFNIFNIDFFKILFWKWFDMVFW